MSDSWVRTQVVQNVSSIKCELPVQFVTKFKINNVVSTHTVVVFELKVRTCQIQLGLDQDLNIRTWSLPLSFSLDCNMILHCSSTSSRSNSSSSSFGSC